MTALQAGGILAYMRFGDWLQWQRRQKKLSQSRIASELGVSRQSVSKWERNESPPQLDLDQTLKLCSILGVSLETAAKAYRGEIETTD